MITLTRIDPARHMARYYHLSIQPDLFGGFQLIRQWGPIDAQGGQERREFYLQEDDAANRLAALAATKRGRGYH